MIKILFVVLLLVLLFGGGAKMIVAGGAATLRIYPGMGHTGIVMALAAPFRSKGPVLDEATDFLRGVTGRRIAPAEAAR